jgi:dTDP-4-amino-4,6-dideoxygalactose transaminase
VETIPFHRPYYGRAAQKYLRAALVARSLDGGGETSRRVEARMSELFDGRHALLTPSCTSALEMSARLAGFGSGDEVIVPAFTFVSSASAISATGARPIFVDIDPKNLCIDLDAAVRACTPRTKGIVVVHYAGQSCDLNLLRKLRHEKKLILIEDAAQALFCSQGSDALGTVGSLGCFSFHDSKVFTSGEGGMLLVNEQGLVNDATRLREKGTNRHEFLAGSVDKYGWVCQGTSAFMSGVAAALLDAQLDERDTILHGRQMIFDIYDAEVRPLALERGWRTIQRAPNERLNYHIYWMVCRTEEERRRFTETLRVAGIQATPHYPSLHLSAYAQERNWQPPHDLPVTEQTVAGLIRLPLYTGMKRNDVARVVETIKQYFIRNE